MRTLLVIAIVCYSISVVCCVKFNGTENTDGTMQREGVECELPRKKGDCGQNITRYYYDSNQGKCRSFSYSGCGGNLNNFDHLDECNLRCICSRPADKGSGPSKIPRLYYNIATDECESFNYRGFGGNVNRFATPIDCRAVCSPFKRRCKTRPNYGKTCQGNSPSTAYYYDINSDTCRSFEYLGCSGGKNRFSSPENCLKRCSTSATPEPPRPRPPICDLQVSRGPCGGNIVRYYYSLSAGRCVTFQFSGCGGNENNFPNLRSCKNACVNIIEGSTTPVTVTSSTSTTTPSTTTSTQRPLPTRCEKERQRGMCVFNFSRYYYDKRDGTCKQFSWSGCGGNNNRFLTMEECRQECIFF